MSVELHLCILEFYQQYCT